MKLYPRNYDTLETSEEVGKALLELIKGNLDLERWGFHLSFTKLQKTSNIKIIYDSKWCRIKFMFSRQRFPDSDGLSMDYGRLHAPNEEPFMIWDGQTCRCWHNILDPLRFLDGLSPSEAYNQAKIEKKLPIIAREFRQSELGKRLLNEYPPKAAIALQSVLWGHYGQMLFELFDQRRPDLWEEYRVFLKEYYRLLDMKATYGPPHENVC